MRRIEVSSLSNSVSR